MNCVIKKTGNKTVSLLEKEKTFKIMTIQLHLIIFAINATQ